jgi:Polysaccharide lyase
MMPLRSGFGTKVQGFFSKDRRTPRSLGHVGVAAAVALTFFVAGGAGQAGSARTTLLWAGDYESGDFGQWERVLLETGGSATIVTKPVAQGRYATKFVLRPQTAANGSRAEAHQPSQDASGGRYGSETWYRWAELVPSSAAFARHRTFNNLIQWKQAIPECSGATLSVNGLTRPVRLFLHVRGGDLVSYDEGCSFRYERSFDLGPLPRDRWLRFRLHVKWSADPNEGFVELWMNGGRKVPFTRVATAPPGVGHYVRQGIYRFRCSCTTVVYGDSMRVSHVDP